MENIKHNNINKFDESSYLSILIGKLEYKKIKVARQLITISIEWLTGNLGIKNILLGVGNSNIHTLRLYQNLVFGIFQVKVKIGY
jgi:hypothetical protein